VIHVAPAYEMIGRMKLVKVAVVQAGGILFDAEAAIAKAERLLAEASGAELVVFPEADTPKARTSGRGSARERRKAARHSGVTMTARSTCPAPP